VPGKLVQKNYGPRPNLHSTDRQAERGDVPPRPPHGHAAGQNARPGQAHEISLRNWVNSHLASFMNYLMANYFQGQHQYGYFWCEFVSAVSAESVHHRLAEGGAGGQEH
jgi:hypothetical protein